METHLLRTLVKLGDESDDVPLDFIREINVAANNRMERETEPLTNTRACLLRTKARRFSRFLWQTCNCHADIIEAMEQCTIALFACGDHEEVNSETVLLSRCEGADDEPFSSS